MGLKPLAGEVSAWSRAASRASQADARSGAPAAIGQIAAALAVNRWCPPRAVLACGAGESSGRFACRHGLDQRVDQLRLVLDHLADLSDRLALVVDASLLLGDHPEQTLARMVEEQGQIGAFVVVELFAVVHADERTAVLTHAPDMLHAGPARDPDRHGLPGQVSAPVPVELARHGHMPQHVGEQAVAPERSGGTDRLLDDELPLDAHSAMPGRIKDAV